MPNRVKPLDKLVAVFPSRIVRFRPKGATEWEERSFTVMVDPKFLEPERATRPLSVTLVTDVEGFYFVEMPGPDLFFALSMALFNAECLVLSLQRFGDVQIREGSRIEEESDSVFFSSRFDQLRETFRENLQRRRPDSESKQ